MNAHRSQRGFSLIELAVVLVIIGLLIGGGIAALNSATQQTRRVEAERQLLHVREALYGYAMSEGRLPCPDTDYPPDGWENWPSDRETNSAGNDCNADEGALPWVQLGLGRRDPWGNPLRYRVERGDGGTPVCGDTDEPDFADPEADEQDPAFCLSDPEDPDNDDYLIVRDADGGTIVDIAPAVVVSYGPQGSQAWTDSSFTCPSPGSSTGFSVDEEENCNGDDNFVAAEPRPPDVGNPTVAGGGRFDDVVIWLPLPVLKSRMVDAGLLP